MERENHSIALDEYLACAILWQQFVDRIIKIQAEVGRWVQTRVHQRPGEPRRIPDVGLDNDVPQGALFRRLLLLRLQELVKRAVYLGEFAQFRVSDEVDAVERRIQRLQSAHIPVIAKEVAQEAARYLRPVRSTTTGYAPHRGVQVIDRKPAAFEDQPLDPGTLRAIDQRVLQLLRIDAGSVLRQQRHRFVGGDHVFHNLLVFEQAHPGQQSRFLGTSLGG